MAVKFSPIWEKMFKNAGLPVPAPVNAWPWPTRESMAAVAMKKIRENLKKEKRGAL